MNMTFRKIALIFSILFSINILIGFFMGFDVFLKSAKESWNRPSYSVADTTYQYQEKIDHYTYLLDSLLEVNPKQAELFAIKLREKYKGEREFSKYKGYALINQNKYEDAILEFKRLNSNKFADDHRQVEYYLAICYENTEQYDSAIFYYKKSDLENNLLRVFWNFEKQSKKDSAIYYLNKAKLKYENSTNVLDNLELIEFINHKLDSLKKSP